jgi:DNA-binding MarR family transcriptional regulator
LNGIESGPFPPERLDGHIVISHNNRRQAAVGRMQASWQEGRIASKTGPADEVTLGVVSELVGYRLRRAFGAFVADFNETVADTGLRQTLIGILSIIQANPGISQGKVGQALAIKRANMVALTGELADMDLVQRQPVEGDRRTLALTLTEKGEDLLERSLVRIHAHEDRLLTGLSPEERVLLLELLAKIEPGPVTPG